MPGRNANTIVQGAFHEFREDDNPTKVRTHRFYQNASLVDGLRDVVQCKKVRCTYCGFVRAKNTTRQVEHLQECLQYRNSSDYVESLSKPGLFQQPDERNSSITFGNSNSPLQPTPLQAQRSSFLMGRRANPNPNLNPQVNRRGSQKRTHDGRIKNGRRPTPRPTTTTLPAQAPSLAAYLLAQNAASFTSATQTSFLSHAGRGTLSSNAMGQWLAQKSHLNRGYIAFVGQLIGKTSLPSIANTQSPSFYRATDLLISALSEIQREMSFFEITATKYSLQISQEVPNGATTSLLGQLALSSSPAASLLEGMVVLWAVEHCCHASWAYAAGISSSLDQPFLPYSAGGDSHHPALHQFLIPHWTSATFAKFVDTCKAMVDELAEAETSLNGREQVARCLGAFNQVLWLWEKNWPSACDAVGENESTSAECFTNNTVSPHSSTSVCHSAGAPDRGLPGVGDKIDEVRHEVADVSSPYVSPRESKSPDSWKD
ncbi:heme oxygenase-like protein [Aureobasidium pullulans]|uniref:Heme oxygenase-like protein n=1 Tax=Aureobasidium pullulans TaxID=5580 RepID=A0A4T0B4L9_AURPU|nr:heme oxygenase-like protein [Aureobasidium pullulans]